MSFIVVLLKSRDQYMQMCTKNIRFTQQIKMSLPVNFSINHKFNQLIYSL